MTHVADTVPYPWPYDGDARRPRPARLALVVAGAQPHWLAPSTPTDVPAHVDALAGAVRGAGGRGRRACATRRRARHGRSAAAARPVGADDWPLVGAPDPATSSVDTPGHRRLLRQPARRRAPRPRASTDLAARRASAPRSRVDSTMRSANDRGYECLIAHRRRAPRSTPTAGARALVQRHHVRRHLRRRRHHRRRCSPRSRAAPTPDPRPDRPTTAPTRTHDRHGRRRPVPLALRRHASTRPAPR